VKDHGPTAQEEKAPVEITVDQELTEMPENE
jgi:hypothetical protein